MYSNMCIDLNMHAYRKNAIYIYIHTYVDIIIYSCMYHGVRTHGYVCIYIYAYIAPAMYLLIRCKYIGVCLSI